MSITSQQYRCTLPYISCISPLYPSYHTVTHPDAWCAVGWVVQGWNGSILVRVQTPRLNPWDSATLVLLLLITPTYTIPVSPILSYHQPTTSTLLYLYSNNKPTLFYPLFPFVCWNETKVPLSLNLTQTPPLSIRYKQQSTFIPSVSSLYLLSLLFVTSSTTNSTEASSSDTSVELSTSAVTAHFGIITFFKPHIILDTLHCLGIESLVSSHTW